MIKHDWAKTKHILADNLSAEEARIVDMLIDRKSTVEIGRMLGQHRSMIWRKMQRLKKRASLPS